MAFTPVDYIASYFGWTQFTPVIPKMYWDVYSAEERVKKICFELHKLCEYANMLGENINIDHTLIKELQAALANIENLDEIDEQVQALQETADAIQSAIETLPDYTGLAALFSKINVIITTFRNESELLSSEVANGDYAATLYKSAPNDMGGCLFYISTERNSDLALTLESGLYANPIYDTEFNFKQVYVNETIDYTETLHTLFTIYNKVDLQGCTIKINGDLQIPAGCELCNGNIVLYNEARLIPNINTSVHDLSIRILDHVENDSGCVVFSNAYTPTGNSCFSNKFDRVRFTMSNSQKATIFAIIAYDVNSSPTGRVGTNGCFNVHISNCSVNTSVYESFCYFRCYGNGWITPIIVSDCWMATPRIALRGENTNDTFCPVFTNCLCQFVSNRVEYFCLLSNGAYTFYNSLCYDYSSDGTDRKEYSFIGSTLSIYATTDAPNSAFAYSTDDGETFNDALLYVKYIPTVGNRNTNRRHVDTVAAGALRRNPRYMTTPSTFGYFANECLGNSAVSAKTSNPNNTGCIGRAYVAGQLANSSFKAINIGMSSQGIPICVEELQDGTNYAGVISTGWCGHACTSANRPANAKIGAQVFDVTLGKPIWYNGSSWVDATGTAV